MSTQKKQPIRHSNEYSPTQPALPVTGSSVTNPDVSNETLMFVTHIGRPYSPTNYVLKTISSCMLGELRGGQKEFRANDQHVEKGLRIRVQTGREQMAGEDNGSDQQGRHLSVARFNPSVTVARCPSDCPTWAMSKALGRC
jgi:hypothetical protein